MVSDELPSYFSLRYRYKTWVTNPKLAQQMAEKVTRRTIGVACCPVAGIPPPNNNEEEEELLEMTHELNLK
jgi:amidase